MAPFNSSEHAPAVFDNADDSRMLTILYGTLGTSIALIGLIVTTLAFLRSCRLWRGTSQLGDSAEVELRDTMARDGHAQNNHSDSSNRPIEHPQQWYHNIKP